MDQLVSTLSTSIIQHLKRHFARYGVPTRVVSDNGPQFTSAGFNQFAESWGFEHVTSSPRYPQSNGKAESAVKVAKFLIRKALMAQEDPWLSILAYRNMPSQYSKTSPVQRYLDRRTRTTLPTRSKLLSQEDGQISSEQVKHSNRVRQERQGEAYNRHGQDLPELQPGQVIRIEPGQGQGSYWSKGQVVKKVASRSYQVETERGTVIRRNRRHLRVSPGVSFVSRLQEDRTSGANAQASPVPACENESETEENPHTTTDATEDIGQPWLDVEQNQPIRTRAGRIIRKPSYLNDYYT